MSLEAPTLSSAAHRDAVATLAEKAAPYFVENQVKWRTKPVSQARIALAVDQLVRHVRDRGVDMATMNGLTAYRDDDGIHVTIELGIMPLE